MEFDLKDYDIVLVNSSSGKDSALMLNKIVAKADAECVSRERIVVAHAIMEEEWKGTPELVREHAAYYGLRVEMEQRPQGTLLQHVKSRGKWPSPQNRYCTSDHKRGQVSKIFTKLVDELRASGRRTQVRILNCLGMRAEESPGRAKLASFEVDKRASNGKRHVDRALPIHKVSDKEAFASLDILPTTPHRCYGCGISRASCVFCIYAPDHQIQRAAMLPENKELWETYLDLEKEIDHTFKINSSLREIEEKIQKGEILTGPDDGKWNM